MSVLTTFTIRAVLDPPRGDREFRDFGQRVLGRMSESGNFPDAGQVLAELGTAVTEFAAVLHDSETQKDLTETVRAKKRALRGALKDARAHVEKVARQHPVDEAKAIIESAGLRTMRITIREKPPLQAKWGKLSGTIVLVALALARGALYVWQFSTDQEHWSDWPGEMKAKTTVTGLTPGVLYYFRVRAHTRRGLTAWSQVVSLMVH